jgi:hypothetical protein
MAAAPPPLRGWLARRLGERLRAPVANAPCGSDVVALLADCDARLATQHAATLLRHADLPPLISVIQSGKPLALSVRLALVHALLRAVDLDTRHACEVLALLLPPHEVPARMGLERELLQRIGALPLPSWVDEAARETITSVLGESRDGLPVGTASRPGAHAPRCDASSWAAELAQRGDEPLPAALGAHLLGAASHRNLSAGCSARQLRHHHL